MKLVEQTPPKSSIYLEIFDICGETNPLRVTFHTLFISSLIICFPRIVWRLVEESQLDRRQRAQRHCVGKGTLTLRTRHMSLQKQSTFSYTNASTTHTSTHSRTREPMFKRIQRYDY